MGDGVSVVVDRLLVALILITLSRSRLSRCRPLIARYVLLFDTIEYFSLVVFT